MLECQLPPQNIDAEESIISSCLVSKSDTEHAVDILIPCDFYRTAHQKIFECIVELADRDKLIDVVVLANLLKSKNQLDEIGGAVYLYKIMDTSPVASNIVQYCEIIKQLAVKRQLIDECTKIHSSCFDNTIDSETLLDMAQQMIMNAERGSIEDKPVLAAELCPELLSTLEKVNKSPDGITGLATNFKKLDEITGGFQNTDLIIIAGRPGMGKTAFALDLAKSFTEYSNPVLVESFEMSNQQLLSRMASKISRVDSTKFRAGGIVEDEWRSINNAMSDISMRPLFINSPVDSDFDRSRRRIKRAKHEHNISSVIIDYMQLYTRKGDFSREDLRVGSMSRDLKQLAKELKIPIIALCQLNRGLEGRTDKRPMLSDLRESGAIEQDADLVLFLYRDEVYNKDSDAKGTGELIIAKHRHGQTGFQKLQWDGPTTTYRNLSIYAGDTSEVEHYGNKTWDGRRQHKNQ